MSRQDLPVSTVAGDAKGRLPGRPVPRCDPSADRPRRWETSRVPSPCGGRRRDGAHERMRRQWRRPSGRCALSPPACAAFVPAGTVGGASRKPHLARSCPSGAEILPDGLPRGLSELAVGHALLGALGGGHHHGRHVRRRASGRGRPGRVPGQRHLADHLSGKAAPRSPPGPRQPAAHPATLRGNAPAVAARDPSWPWASHRVQGGRRCAACRAE